MTKTSIVQSQFISPSHNIHNINLHKDIFSFVPFFKNIFANVKYELLCFTSHVLIGIIFGVRKAQMNDT
jgi:uncharacterized pyridoxamine 5'-phosphate oxidase family protein